MPEIVAVATVLGLVAGGTVGFIVGWRAAVAFSQFHCKLHNHRDT